MHYVKIGSGLLFVGITYFYFVIPILHIHIPCVFHQLTGFYCPGCGMTRAIMDLLQLNFPQSFQHNMLLYGSIPFFIVYEFAVVTERTSLQNRTAFTLLVITISFGVLRNLEAFHYLAP